MRVGKGPQQGSVHDAEEHAVGADAQRQREHDDGAEAGVAKELSHRIAEVLLQVAHASFPIDAPVREHYDSMDCFRSVWSDAGADPRALPEDSWIPLRRS